MVREGNWGRWGEQDERGALNLLTPERVLAALQTPRTGKLYSLSMPIERTGPHLDYRGAPQRLTLTNHSDESMFVNGFGGRVGVGANEDIVVMGTHTATHMDALCHVYADGATYNGHPHDGMSSYGGAAYSGIEKAGTIVTRGVLIDVAAAKGLPHLDFGYAITADDLQTALKQQGVELRPGDAVLIRTGWLELFMETDEMRLDQPGLSLEAARFLGEQDVAVVGADNTSVEVQPWSEGEFLGGHIELLVKRGIHLIEHLSLAELSADNCYQFLFATAPLRIVGATGSPVNPIAVG
ncbi:cyclase family protein [Arthrobacter sp. E918]|uniref:Cyclase family protein n=2 Tax=Arthrobacter mobilis TaxID=2724944 RepID=A0A7X6HEY3_9MICC|nr:cyclase family protein [Arthrobacter mobilis]